jgi:hypothetical protein
MKTVVFLFLLVVLMGCAARLVKEPKLGRTGNFVYYYDNHRIIVMGVTANDVDKARMELQCAPCSVRELGVVFELVPLK